MWEAFVAPGDCRGVAGVFAHSDYILYRPAEWTSIFPDLAGLHCASKHHGETFRGGPIDERIAVDREGSPLATHRIQGDAPGFLLLAQIVWFQSAFAFALDTGAVSVRW
jgi:hypothetical protein